MASIKKKSSGGGGANWMDTYGDMVTLLLCFFVLLYSMSTIDTDKWKWIVEQFNKNYDPTQSVEPGPTPGPENLGGGSAMPATQVDEALDELFDYLVKVAQNNSDTSISVSRGDGYVFISFDDTVFFDGNSSYLRAEGQALLDSIIPGLEQAGEYIDELKVLGHTAQQYADRPNKTRNDRELASSRATEVVIYLQDRLTTLDPGRLVAVGHGQWRPVASNKTNEERAKNRRVELVITGEDEKDGILDGNYEHYYTMYELTTGESVGGAD